MSGLFKHSLDSIETVVDLCTPSFATDRRTKSCADCTSRFSATWTRRSWRAQGRRTCVNIWWLSSYTSPRISASSPSALRSVSTEAPDLTTSHVLVLVFAYDPDPTSVLQRFTLPSAEMRTYDDLVAEAAESAVSRAQCVQGRRSAARRQDVKSRVIMERTWVFETIDTIACNIKTGEVCRACTSSFFIAESQSAETDSSAPLLVEMGFSVDMAEGLLPCARSWT